MRYLLDTNMVSDLVRRPQGRVALRVGEIGEAQVCTSIIVAVLPFEAPVHVSYGLLRARHEQAGQPIGGNDLLIAAQALALRCTLGTDNEREFARISELSQENWLR